VLSYLYLASMVLKRHHDNGAPPEDLPVVEWACRSLLYRAQEQLHDFLRNFPNRLLAAFMRLVIFPRGRTYFAPSDRLGAQLAELAMTPSGTRERLCRDAYRNPQGGNPLGLLEEALRLSIEVEPLERRLRVEGVKTGRVTALDFPGQVAQARSLGLLTDTQAQQLIDYDQRIMHLINVDDFDPQELRAAHG